MMPRRKATISQPIADGIAPVSARTSEQQAPGTSEHDNEASPGTLDQSANPIPADWQHGALLNVRNNGDYFVTLFPEEYDYRHPERALRFNNSAVCQNFVSRWYARESFDGRA